MSNLEPADTRAAQRPPLFDAVLTPNRSLPRAGFYAVMAVFGGASFAFGLAFYLMGAWPVAGFLGLDLALLWLAFRLSYRSGRLTEIVRLTYHSLTVRRILPSGRAREWRFQPYWLRVEIDDPPQSHSPLTLTSHGRRLTIAAFLTADERLALGRALGAALRKLRCLPQPAPSA